MNCHDNKNGKQNGIKHLLHMILCCGLPILILLLIPFIARISPVSAGVLGVITPFLCPVMMIGMMLWMYIGRNKSNNGGMAHSEKTDNVQTGE